MALVKYNNNSISAITSTGLTAGAMTLIKEQTASASATISFVNGTSDVVLDSTYPIYLFKFINIHPANATYFSVNFSDDGGSNYDLVKTSSAFAFWNDEAGTANLSSLPLYRAAYDIAQGTGIAPMGGDTMSNAADNGGAGFMYLFSPSSTVFVKHWIARFKPNYSGGSDPYTTDSFHGGYINTTAAVTAVQFKMNSGEIQGGKIKMYGLKDSA